MRHEKQGREAKLVTAGETALVYGAATGKMLAAVKRPVSTKNGTIYGPE